MVDIDRRQALASLLAGAGAPLLGSGASAMDLKRVRPLAFQAHSTRIPLARDFPGTLRVMKAMGFDAVELASFPGFVGDRRGDFTPLQSLKPGEVRRIIQDSGLTCEWCVFLPAQFTPENLPRALDWAHGVGITHMTYAGLNLPARPTMDDLKAQLDVLNEAGGRVHAAGLQLVFFTDGAVWRTLSGESATDEMMRRLDPRLVPLQIDFGTVVQTHADGAAILERWPNRFVSVVLRDAKQPADTSAYLPAAPLGTGDVDWAAVMRTAMRSGVKNYAVAMTRYSGGVLDGMKQSIDYLRALQV
jgi:sugar phosphate isomerase/epimerase